MQNFNFKPLLFAGVFLSWSVIADNCAPLINQEISLLTFTSSCPLTTTVDVNGDKCIVRRKSRAGQAEFICAEADGTFLGGPWEHTGTAASVQPGDGSTGPLTNIVTPPSVNVSSKDDLPSFSSKLTESIGALAKNQIALDNRAIQRQEAILQNAGYQSALLSNRLDSVVNLQYVIQNNLSNQIAQASDRALQEHTALSSQLALSYQALKLDNEKSASDLTEVLNKVNSIDQRVAYISNMQLVDPMTREAKHAEILQAISQVSSGGSGGGSSDEYLVLSSIESLIGTTNSRLKDATRSLSSIDTKLSSGTGGGSATDMTETNQRLNDINNTLATNAQGLSQQLGQQLYSIQSAIENGSGGGGGSDDDTETNAKLDGIAGQLGKTNEGIDKLVESLTPGDQQADPLTESDIQKETDKIGIPDYQKASDDGLKSINDAMAAHDDDVKKVEGLTDAFKGVASVSEFFRNAPAQCAPLVLGGRELDLCNRTDDIRTVLTYIFYMLTIIFLIRSASHTIENLRLS